MKIKNIDIENFRAIEKSMIPIHEKLTVFHGDNALGKTSFLRAISVGLGLIPTMLPRVTGISFAKSDIRNDRGPARVAIETTDGLRWDVSQTGRLYKKKKNPMDQPSSRYGRSALKKFIDVLLEEDDSSPREMPIVAFYDTDRAVFDLPQRRRGFQKQFSRFEALEDSLSARTNFKALFAWFYAKENEELREQRDRSDFNYSLSDLDAVRSAITQMMPEITKVHIELSPLRFMLNFIADGGKEEKLSIDQLSGGYRIVLALAADLARRMAQGNPHLPNPLLSNAVVLIDEIELHLHPKWQQRVLDDLARTFPNAQFIVSTHSPQVLTTVRSENIIALKRRDGKIKASYSSMSTYGAEAGEVLSVEMGVSERPPENEFSILLNGYLSMVSQGKSETEEAKKIRNDLDAISPNDSALDKADSMIRRQNLRKKESS